MPKPKSPTLTKAAMQPVERPVVAREPKRPSAKLPAINVRVEPAIARQFKVFCAHHDMSLTDFVVQAGTAFIAQREG